MATIRSAEVFPPGEFIRDELEARGWTQEDLATILDRPLKTVNQIINGSKQITPETATRLASAFSTSAEFWMNLESAYRLSLVQDDGSDTEKMAKLHELLPLKQC